MTTQPARAHAAKKTTATPAKETAAPARAAGSSRKTTAKKTTAKKTTGRRRKISLIKPAIQQGIRHHHTLHPDFTDAEVFEARAALAATAGGIQVPIGGWTASYGGGAEQQLPGGIRLRHGGRHGEPFTASIPCLLGTPHVYDDIRTAADLDAAQHIADTCNEPHTDLAALAFGPGKDSETTLTIPLQQAHAAQDDIPQDGGF